MIYLADHVTPPDCRPMTLQADARGSRSSAAEVVDWDLEATSPSSRAIESHAPMSSGSLDGRK